MKLIAKMHYGAILHIIDYCVKTLKRRILLKQNGKWDEISREYEFEIEVGTDSNDTKCHTSRSMMECAMYLNGASVSFTSSTQKW